MDCDHPVVLVDPDVVHARRAVAEPDPEHIGMDLEVLLGHLDRRTAVDCEAAASAE
jgi:hypothetical protein